MAGTLNALARRWAGVEVRRARPETPFAYSKQGRTWRYARDGRWIGGVFAAPNFSQGYHGLLQQWWESYATGSRVLLVSENNDVKRVFQARYPQWAFTTTDNYDNLGQPVDLVADLCAGVPEGHTSAFDLVICQATLEHVYAPFASLQHMVQMCRPAGIVVIHTHTPPYPYHPYPRDYIRFQLDWFQDIPQWIPGTTLLELYAADGHVFATYRREATRD